MLFDKIVIREVFPGFAEQFNIEDICYKICLIPIFESIL